MLCDEQNALQNRVIKLDDAAKIVPINLQIQNGSISENGSKSKNLVIAPSVHQNDKPKVDLDGIVLMKKSKTKKKKKKKDKEKGSRKKRKLKETKEHKESGDGEQHRKKRRKMDSEQTHSTDSNVTKKLSEWERE